MRKNALSSTRTTLFIVLVSKLRPVTIQPILLRRMQLRCGEWSVRALRVNRHLQPFDRFAPHSHSHGQMLLYLRGRGEQRVGRRQFIVGPGAVFFIPPGRIHEFRERAPRRAVCLVADLGGNASKQFGFRHGWLSAESLATVRQHVASLSKEADGSLDLAAGGAALLIIETCRLCCSGEHAEARMGHAIVRRLQRVWRPDEHGCWPRPAELAQRVGLQKDYLNRLVRRACGLTLGQWRDHELLRTAESDLKSGRKVTDVATDLHFGDPSYFARWFRKQTGMPPTQWRDRAHGRLEEPIR